jgi:hypothetical protein
MLGERTFANDLICLLDSLVFLILSAVIIATSMYLPQHISTIASRAYFYYSGDEGAAAGLSSSPVPNTLLQHQTGATVVKEL